MLTTLIAAPLFLVVQSASAAPALSLQQQTSLRCAAAFALVAEGQASGGAKALAYPPLAERGREFFVRSAARIMDEAGLDRAQISAALSTEAQKLSNDGTLDEAMPACLMLLDASGIPDTGSGRSGSAQRN